jgi:cytochrome P450
LGRPIEHSKRAGLGLATGPKIIVGSVSACAYADGLLRASLPVRPCDVSDLNALRIQTDGLVAATEAVKFPFERVGLDVAPELATLRERQALLRVEMPYGGEGWLVTRYADARFVWSDRRFSLAATVNADVPRVSEKLTPPGHLMAMDPPEHSRLRKLVARAFSRRAAQAWRLRAGEIVEELIAGLRANGSPADLVENFSVPLPVTVICELLGVPKADRSLFRHFAEIMLSTTAASLEEMLATRDELIGYLSRHISARRARPQEERSADLLTDLVRARDQRDQLSETELLMMGINMIVAGHETTANSLSNFVYTLLDTGRWEWLAQNQEKIGIAIDELLRYVQLGSTGTPARVAMEDVEMAGQLVRAGESAIIEINSANRDEAIFANAETLNLERAHNPHVTFGYGPHLCLGAQLARMELQVAMGGLLRHFPDLRLAGSAADVAWRAGGQVRGPRELLVSWGQ